MHDELPPLRWRQITEGRHPGVRVAAADLPEQRSICLRLHVRLQQVGRFGGTTAIVTVTTGAPLLKQLAAAGGGVRPTAQRIGFAASSGGASHVASRSRTRESCARSGTANSNDNIK